MILYPGLDWWGIRFIVTIRDGPHVDFSAFPVMPMFGTQLNWQEEQEPNILSILGTNESIR